MTPVKAWDDVADAVRASMRSNRAKDTGPEMKVRRLLWRSGYRYRLHRADLPGKPDIVFPGKRKIIFVHGCFWHQHAGCKRANVPRSRTEYWGPKLQRNVERHERQCEDLSTEGWDCLTVWECQLKDPPGLLSRIEEFLSRSVAGSNQR